MSVAEKMVIKHVVFDKLLLIVELSLYWNKLYDKNISSIFVDYLKIHLQNGRQYPIVDDLHLNYCRLEAQKCFNTILNII